jgi:predicted SAM-dependent methyltransferase
MNLVSPLKAGLRRWVLANLADRGFALQPVPFVRGNVVDSYFENLYRQGYSSDSLDSKRLYNVGAGHFRHNYWTNIDLRSGSLSECWVDDDLDFDLSRNEPLPLPDGQAELIYTSHTIEHVRDASVSNLLKESYRVLRKGGVIRIVCPDVALAEAAYDRGDIAFFEQIYRENIPSLEHGLVRFFATELVAEDSPNTLSDDDIKAMREAQPGGEWRDLCLTFCSDAYQKMHPDNHINWLDEAKLVGMLEASGFHQVSRSRYGQSGLPVLRDIRHFDSTLPHMSFYVEAIK